MGITELFPALSPFLRAEWKRTDPEVDIANPDWSAVASALVDAVLRSPGTVAEVLPALKARSDVDVLRFDWFPEGAPIWSTRTRNCVAREMYSKGWKTWADLAEADVSEMIRWRNSGEKTVREIIRAAVDLTASVVNPSTCTSPATMSIEGTPTSESDEPVEDPAQPSLEMDSASGSPGIDLASVQSDLEQILSWGQAVAGGVTLGGVLELLGSGRAPSEISEAVERVGTTPVTSIFRSRLTISETLRKLVDDLDERQLAILDERVLRLGGKQPTLDVIGTRFGITRERVRQIEVGITRRIREEFEQSRASNLKWAAEWVSRSLGRQAPVNATVVHEMWMGLLGPEMPERHRAILLWLAGPYRLIDGLYCTLAPEDLARELGATVNLLGFVEGDVGDLLSLLGIVEQFHSAAMEACPGFRIYDGRMVRWSGPISEKAAIVLSSLGREATARELLELIGEGSLGNLKNAMARDDRFVRSGPDRYVLTHWDLESYSGVSDAIGERIRNRGGEVDLGELIEELTRKFGVAESSIRIYASAPLYRVENGKVRFRRTDEMKMVAPDLSRVRGAFEYNRCIVLLVTCDAELLRGSGRVCAVGLSAALGVQPGDDRRFEGDAISVSIQWPMTSAQPTLGSMRTVCEALGLGLGDRARLVFDLHRGRVTAEKIPDNAFSGEPSVAAFAQLTGLDVESEAELFRVLGSNLRCAPIGVAAALRERGDEDVLALLPGR